MLEALPPIGYSTYALALVGLWIALGAGRWLRERGASLRMQRAIEAGQTEPPSLHPVIDPARCVGCGACTHACPEGRIIGMIGGKAQLLDPGSCIGHGACKSACPAGAIELVFGTARRGVDLPVVTADFESSVPGLFIAGELGGMGLIANAIDQGRKAIEAITRQPGIGKPDLYDVIIVGSGPAGIAASLAAKERGLRALTLEQDTLGGTVAHYPRGKLVMTRPARLPLYGTVRARRVRKERLLTLWRTVIRDTGIEIHDGVRVERILKQPWGFELATTAGPCRAGTVLLATGRRGSPRRLAVPGEELSSVVYSLDDPAQYRGKRVLVVGGGDSAAEAAVALTRQAGVGVTLCHRGAQIDRASPANRRRLDDAIRTGRLKLLVRSQVCAIEPQRVTVEQDGRRVEFVCDAVIVCIGGMLPTTLLTDAGIRVETRYGTADAPSM